MADEQFDVNNAKNKLQELLMQAYEEEYSLPKYETIQVAFHPNTPKFKSTVSFMFRNKEFSAIGPETTSKKDAEKAAALKGLLYLVNPDKISYTEKSSEESGSESPDITESIRFVPGTEWVSPPSICYYDFYATVLLDGETISDFKISGAVKNLDTFMFVPRTSMYATVKKVGTYTKIRIKPALSDSEDAVRMRIACFIGHEIKNMKKPIFLVTKNESFAKTLMEIADEEYDTEIKHETSLEFFKRHNVGV